MPRRSARRTNRHLSRAGAGDPANNRSSDRRGTVLLIALGALGVIALAGLSYVTFVRIDRVGATTSARVANFDQQVDATVDWIGTLIAADLYGNKIVSPSLPRHNIVEGFTGDRVYAWPTRFEDGEHRDHPNTDVRTFAPGPIDQYEGQIEYELARLDLMPTDLTGSDTFRFEPATPDDAWLAQLEPTWNSFNNLADNLQWRSVWTHITNLRSAYVYVDNADNPEDPTPTDLTDDAYVRLDGRYADLGQFFLDPVTVNGVQRANPAADLSVVEAGRGLDDDGNPQSLNPLNAPYAPINTMDTPNDPQRADLDLNNIDTRFWVDTDGDLRADARWQEIDALGSLYGFRWVVGARVVDLSGLVNINTATATGDLGNAFTLAGPLQDRLPTGRTPADVDLFRVMGTTRFDHAGEFWYGINNERYDFNVAQADGNLSKELRDDQLFTNPSTQTTFNTHLRDGLNLFGTTFAADRENAVASARRENFLINLTPVIPDANPANPGSPAPSPTFTRSDITADNFYTVDDTFGAFHAPDFTYTPPADAYIPRRYREDHYLNAGVRAGAGRSDADRGYRPTEMIDLVTFWGTNRRDLLSQLEQRIDGPLDSSGYLPSPSIPTPLAFGPMESASEDVDSRAFFDNTINTVPRPTATEMRFGLRNQLTTVSGASDLSPVPNLNVDARDPNDQPIYANLDPSTAPLEFRRISLADVANDDKDFVRRAFQANLWALAPLAFNEVLTGELTRPSRLQDDREAFDLLSGARLADEAGSAFTGSRTAALSDAFYYGGGLNGEASRFLRDDETATTFDDAGLGLIDDSILPLSDPRTAAASYAVLTSLKLAVNTKDAFDTDSRPSVARFFATNTGVTGAGLTGPASGGGASIGGWQFVPDIGFEGKTNDVTYLGTQTRMGEIPSQLLDQRVLGRFITSAQAETMFFQAGFNTSDFSGNMINFLDGEDSVSTTLGPGDARDDYFVSIDDPAPASTGAAGLTVVGLEQQPFIAEVFSTTIYSNDPTEVPGALGNLIQAADPEHQIGSFFCVQLINPWPDDIAFVQESPNRSVLKDYELWLLDPNSTSGQINDPANTPLRFRFVVETDPGVSPIPVDYARIPAGMSMNFVIEDFANDAVAAEFASSRDDYTNDLTSTEFDYQGTLEILTPGIDVDDPGVFYHPWATSNEGVAPRLVLVRRLPGDLDAPAVVDKLIGRPEHEFPAHLGDPTDPDVVFFEIIDQDIFVDPNGSTIGSLYPDISAFSRTDASEGYDPIEVANNFLPDNVRGRVAVSSSLSRPVAAPLQPDDAAIIGDPNPNIGRGLSKALLDFGPSAVANGLNDLEDLRPSTVDVVGDNPMGKIWLTNLTPAGNVGNNVYTIPLDEYSDFLQDSFGAASTADANNTLSYNDGTTDLFSNTTRADTLTSQADPVPAFEVLIPDGPAFSKADLALVSKHAHLCLNNRLDRLDSWITAGEQFAAEARASGTFTDIQSQVRYRTRTLGVVDLASSIPGFASNPSVTGGILDTLGYPFPSDEGAIPDTSLALPLALRLFDAYEALDPPALDEDSRLFSGRVNINTATQRVLEALPYVAPFRDYFYDEIPDPIRQGDSINVSANPLRARGILAYRDGIDPGSTTLGNTNIFNFLEGTLAIGLEAVHTPDFLTNLTNALLPADPVADTDSSLRRPDRAFEANGLSEANNVVPLGRGFASAAELAILDVWAFQADDAAAAGANIATPFDGAGDFFGNAETAPGFVREFATDSSSTDFTRADSPLGQYPFEGVDSTGAALAAFNINPLDFPGAFTEGYDRVFGLQGAAPRPVPGETIAEFDGIADPNLTDTVVPDASVQRTLLRAIAENRNTPLDIERYEVPQGGQAERIALYRALANIVETRSDVFGAWFVLRAYDPNTIETIRVIDTEDIATRMEDDAFTPAYESRWFVVFDRSNVKSPDDRPRVLLKVELPPTTP